MVERDLEELPSPCGDKLFHRIRYYKDDPSRLPSPCGDKLFPGWALRPLWSRGYRPLAGISCFFIPLEQTEEYRELPSPCGDKLFLQNETDKASMHRRRIVQPTKKDNTKLRPVQEANRGFPHNPVRTGLLPPGLTPVLWQARTYRRRRSWIIRSQ